MTLLNKILRLEKSRMHVVQTVRQLAQKRHEETSQYSCKVLILGGGSGGMAMVQRCQYIVPRNRIIMIEPLEYHYYQPHFLLLASGVYPPQPICKSTKSMLPPEVVWLRDTVTHIEPKSCKVKTCRGYKIKYDMLIVALGVEMKYEQIPGLELALERQQGVCSVYSCLNAQKAYRMMKRFREGNIIFTNPCSQVKTPSASQAYMYVIDDYLRTYSRRDSACLAYCSAQHTLFDVEKYDDELHKVAEQKDIELNLGWNLVKIDSDKNIATFRNEDDTKCIEFSVLHVTPPQAAPELISKNAELADCNGFLEVDKHTLQHVRYCNIYGIGDCTNVPTMKSACAVGAQSGVVRRNVKATFGGKDLPAKYNGYSACSIYTASRKCVLAEFDYTKQPQETIPLIEGKSSHLSYYVAKNVLSFIYWNCMIRGLWEEPSTLRKILHLNMSR